MVQSPIFAGGSAPPAGPGGPARPLRVGVGRASAHHGELLQGVFEDERGRLHRGLITLPLPTLSTTATLWPRAQARGIRTRPAGRVKAARAAALTLGHLGYRDVGGDLTLEGAIPLGHGYGSSTADVIAAIRAVAASAGRRLTRSLISRLAVRAETASDAVAYGDDVVLFAQREGTVIEHLAGEYPPYHVVSLGPLGGCEVDTLRLPPARYDASEIGQFRVLRGLARHAVERQDPRLLGRVATASALISQRHLAKPHLAAALRLAEEHGACGVQVAHSGSLIGILIEPGGSMAERTAAALLGAAREAGFAGASVFALDDARGVLP